MNRKLKTILAAAALVAVGSLSACANSADIASQNLSNQADHFQIDRKITFYNGTTGKDILVITGYCSLGNNDPVRQLSVTCKTGPNKYIKDFLGLSNNVTYMVEQLQGADVSTTHYNVTWIPQSAIPNIQVK